MKKVVILFVALSLVLCGCGGKEATEKTVTLVLKITINQQEKDRGKGASFTGTGFQMAPEVIWYRNNAKELSEYVDKYPPITVKHMVKYKTDNIPEYKAKVNLRAGYGEVHDVLTATFDIANGETSRTVDWKTGRAYR